MVAHSAAREGGSRAEIRRPSLRMVQIFVQALLLSVPHITALLFMLLLVDILAAALLREVEDLEVFTDVPVTMWFAIVTMTTLGRS